MLVYTDLCNRTKNYTLPDSVISNIENNLNVNITTTINPKAEIYWGDKLTDHHLKAMPNIKWIHLSKTGYGKFNLPKDILITNTPDSSNGVAEYALAGILYMLRGLNNMPLDRKSFDPNIDYILPFNKIKCLIVGYGRIGKQLSKLLSGLNIKNDKITRSDNIEPILLTNNYHFVINCLPFNTTTLDYFNKSVFNCMDDNSYFLNVGRGEIFVTITFDEFFSAASSTSNRQFNFTISNAGATLLTGHNSDIGTPSVSGFAALQTQIDAYIAAGGNSLGPIELTRIEIAGDFDSTAERLKNFAVGGEEFIDSVGGVDNSPGSNAGPETLVAVWSGSLSTYGGPDELIADLNGIDDGTAITLGNGSPTAVDMLSVAGNNPIQIQGELDGDVDYVSAGSFPHPTFRLGFRIPLIPNLIHVLPTGTGLFVGRELDRDGGENNLGTVLGNKNHAVTITHVAEENASTNETSGLRIIVGDANDNTGIGGAAGGEDSANSFITFDFKNAQETHGFERMGFIGTSPTSGQPMSLQSVSDKRLKENIKLTKKGLSIIKEIKVRDFNWKKYPNSETTGFIAQELYKVIPEAVLKGGSNPKMNPWTLNYQALIPYMVKAIQEQQKLIENLQKQIDQLK